MALGSGAWARLYDLERILGSDTTEQLNWTGLQKRYSEEETQCWLCASYVSLTRLTGWGCALGPVLCWAELPLGRRASPRRLQAGLWQSGEGSGGREARCKHRKQEYGIRMKTESQTQEEPWAKQQWSFPCHISSDRYEEWQAAARGLRSTHQGRCCSSWRWTLAAGVPAGWSGSRIWGA